MISLSSLPYFIQETIFDYVDLEDTLKFLRTNQALRLHILKRGPFTKTIKTINIQSNHAFILGDEIYLEKVLIQIESLSMKIEDFQELIPNNPPQSMGIFMKMIKTSKSSKIKLRQDRKAKRSLIEFSQLMPKLRLVEEMTVTAENFRFFQKIFDDFEPKITKHFTFFFMFGGDVSYDEIFVRNLIENRLNVQGILVNELPIQLFRHHFYQYSNINVLGRISRGRLDFEQSILEILNSGFPSTNPRFRGEIYTFIGKGSRRDPKTEFNYLGKGLRDREDLHLCHPTTSFEHKCFKYFFLGFRGKIEGDWIENFCLRMKRFGKGEETLWQIAFFFQKVQIKRPKSRLIKAIHHLNPYQFCNCDAYLGCYN